MDFDAALLVCLRRNQIHSKVSHSGPLFSVLPCYTKTEFFYPFKHFLSQSVTFLFHSSDGKWRPRNSGRQRLSRTLSDMLIKKYNKTCILHFLLFSFELLLIVCVCICVCLSIFSGNNRITQGSKYLCVIQIYIHMYIKRAYSCMCVCIRAHVSKYMCIHVREIPIYRGLYNLPPSEFHHYVCLIVHKMRQMELDF